jgi:hypothetical protein
VTFILSALTQHEVIQVSDRRFTYYRGGKVVDCDDEKNKAVLSCGRILFGFAGLGELGTERQTDLWLAERVREIAAASGTEDQGVLLEGIREKATALFKKLRYKGNRQAFVGTGWARFLDRPAETPAQPQEFRPYLALISNFHDDEGAELDRVTDEFSLQTRILQEGEGGYVLDVPHHLTRGEMDSLTEKLATADWARDARALAAFMGEQIKAVAARDDGVGEGLMITSLPRASLVAGPGMFTAASGPLADIQTFLYIPPSGDTVVQLGPVTTCGGVVTQNFRAGPPPPDLTFPKPGPTLPEDPPGLVRRWYLVPIVGSGVESDPYRAETHGRGGSPVMPSDQEGRPKYDVALVVVSSQDHGQLESDPRIFPVGDLLDLDRLVGALSDEKHDWIEAVTQHRGVSLEGSVRDVLRRLGQQLQADFDETNYWVK